MDESGVYKRDEGDRPVEHSPRGRYIRFDIKLGSGAYKTVYKAYDTDQGIDVAWNAIDIGVLPSAEKTRIIQEVQLLQKLEHKNIINFYGSWFSKEKNQVVFITEIMTSGTLKSYIKRVQFVKWKIIKRWCIQILEGLHYLHSQNPPVIHRDLKCDNIFINGNTGDLRIGDLGLSTQLAVHKKAAQSVLGTPEFMAPELYDESYDEKVDIYAFGMCVLEMVTKEVPYSECINPAQIYKKVTAGIRPRGLQRIVSQAAKDFIELCLSRGNGLVDVSAEYLLDHPFLKAQDDDGEMVRCLEEEELEREIKQEQERLAHISEESFAQELNMESHSKGSNHSSLTDRRKTFPSLSLEPEELSSTSSAASSVREGNRSLEARSDGFAEEKSAGMHRMVDLPPAHPVVVDQTGHPQPPPQLPTQAVFTTATPSLPPLPPAVAASVALSAATSMAPSMQLQPQPGTATQPIVEAPVAVDAPVDEPLSGKKDLDHNVNQFLATLPGTESKIQNNRMNVMGGRGQRLELETSRDADEPEEPKIVNRSEAKGQAAAVAGVPNGAVTADGVSVTPAAPTQVVPAAVDPATAAVVASPEPTVAAPAMSMNELAASPALAPVPAIPVPAFPARTPSETIVDYSQLRRPSFQADHLVAPVPIDYEAAGRLSSRPTSASSSMSMSSANAALQKKRGRRHEIRAEKDPDSDHSIMLYLRLMIDGKSKEIKFPFNLFSDSTHDVACELALDVGILESDLEDIADSISFLATEGKINNLPHVSEDVWEEAPEPHSFSSKPLPHVSKMNFVTNPGMSAIQLQQFPSHLLSPSPAALDTNPSAPAYSLGEPAFADSSSSSASHSGTIAASGGGATVAQPQLGLHQPPGGLNATTDTLVKAVPPLGDLHSTGLLDASSSNVRDGTAATFSSSTASIGSSSDVPRSPHLHPQLMHATSEISMISDDHFPAQVEGWERGISVGSVNDPNFMRKVHGMEDRLKIARSAFDERDSNLVAAMRDAEEKHQREVERFRRQMEELSKQRAAIASSERQPEDVDLGLVNLDESMVLGIGHPAGGHPSNGVNGALLDHRFEQNRGDSAGAPMLVRNASDSRRQNDSTVTSAMGNGHATAPALSTASPAIEATTVTPPASAVPPTTAGGQSSAQVPVPSSVSATGPANPANGVPAAAAPQNA